MALDLSSMLNDWPHEPGKLNVRLIKSSDGSEKIQVRVDLGILQMETTGRPDGTHPKGYDSLLEYFEARLDGIELEPDESPDDDFALSPEECRALREEAIQYYHRYTALMVLEDFEGVVRDTTRNLRVIDMLTDFAEAEEDAEGMQQYRPYIMMIRARAMASLALREDEPKAAVYAIDEGLRSLEIHFAAIGEPESFNDSNEARLLRGMKDALVPKLPVSQKSELHKRLRRALESENYELAAILRDELNLLKDQQGA